MKNRLVDMLMFKFQFQNVEEYERMCQQNSLTNAAPFDLSLPFPTELDQNGDAERAESRL